MLATLRHGAAPFNLDFRILEDSPCLDAGDSSLVISSTDFQRDPRIFGISVDVGPDEFYGIGATGVGTIVDSLGNPENLLTANQSFGNPARLVPVRLGAAFSLEVATPSLNIQAAQFVCFGTLGIPGRQDLFPIGFLGADFSFVPASVDPSNSSLFTLANSFDPLNDGLAPGAPTPWSVVSPGFAFPLTFTLQALILDDQGQFGISNVLVVAIR